MPVVGEEQEEGIGRGVVEDGFGQVIVVVHHVGLVLAVGLGTVVLDDAETLGAAHHILEIDVMVMALAAALGKGTVLAVLHADHQRGALDGVLARRDGEQIVGGQPAKHGLPLGGVALILGVELAEIDGGMGTCGREALSPLPFFGPLGGLFLGLLVGRGLGIDLLGGHLEAEKGAEDDGEDGCKMFHNCMFFSANLRIFFKNSKPWTRSTQIGH